MKPLSTILYLVIFLTISASASDQEDPSNKHSTDPGKFALEFIHELRSEQLFAAIRRIEAGSASKNRDLVHQIRIESAKNLNDEKKLEELANLEKLDDFEYWMDTYSRIPPYFSEEMVYKVIGVIETDLTYVLIENRYLDARRSVEMVRYSTIPLVKTDNGWRIHLEDMPFGFSYLY